jgi:hypothetical protein
MFEVINIVVFKVFYKHFFAYYENVTLFIIIHQKNICYRYPGIPEVETKVDSHFQVMTNAHADKVMVSMPTHIKGKRYT